MLYEKGRIEGGYLPPRVNFLNLPPRPRPAAPGGPPGAMIVVDDGLAEVGILWSRWKRK